YRVTHTSPTRRSSALYKFFEEDALNNAYVYTDRNYTVSTSDYKTIFPTAKQIKSDLLADVKNTVLIKETIDKPDVRITDDEVTRSEEHTSELQSRFDL